MASFGKTTHQRPTKVDELLGSKLMSSLDRLDIVARKIFSGKIQGERRSKRRGISVEFADYREYTAGDDIRFIDWNVYARLDRLFMKIFMEEEEPCSRLIVFPPRWSMADSNENRVRVLGSKKRVAKMVWVKVFEQR